MLEERGGQGEGEGLGGGQGEFGTGVSKPQRIEMKEVVEEGRENEEEVVEKVIQEQVEQVEME